MTLELVTFDVAPYFSGSHKAIGLFAQRLQVKGESQRRYERVAGRFNNSNRHSTKDRRPLGSYSPSSEYGSHYLNSNCLITFKRDNSVSSKLLNLNKRKMGERDGSLHICEELGKMKQTPGSRTRPEGP